MHFAYEVIIPADTDQTAPYEKILPLSSGVITGMQIVIPAGHSGTAHLILLFHEFQLYPLSRGEDYHGDDVQIQFSDRFDMEADPFQLKAIGWNSDTVNDHRFQVYIEVMRPELIGMNTGTQNLQQLQALVMEKLKQ